VEGRYIAEGTRLFHVTDDPEQAARAPVGTSVYSSIRLGVEQLVASLPMRARPVPALSPWGGEPTASDPISGAFAMCTIARGMPRGAVIVEEAPSHRNDLHAQFPIVSSGGFYACASGGLGFGLPAAVGVALGDPSRKVIAVLGDGSSLYTIQGLWTAAQHKLPITFVILNNAGYGAVKSLGERMGIARMPGSEVPGVDFVEVARGFGCGATRVERAADLAPALAAAFATPEPTLVEVRMARGIEKLY
jgi:benzoylformate decarboxylase